MANRGEKRRKSDGTSKLSLPVTKKTRGITTSNADSRDSACIRRENEKFNRDLESARDDLRDLQLQEPCHRTRNEITEGQTSALIRVTQCSSESHQENEKRLLEEKLQSCRSQLNDKDVKIAELQNSAMDAEEVRQQLETKVEKMQEQLSKELEGSGSYADGGATPFLLESTLKAVQLSASSFTKVFLEYSKSENADVNFSLGRHFQNPYLTRPRHVTYLVRAWTFETLFSDFENESFSCGGASIFLDHTKWRAKYFQYFELLGTNASVFDPYAEASFERFFRRKWRQFLLLWKLSPNQIIAPNLSSARDLEVDPAAIENFRSLAKGVWMLHKLSFSFQSRADIFRVRQQTDLNAEYMDSVVSLQDDERFISKVGFMICPGFRLKRSIVKCQVYLAGKSNGG